MPVAVESLHSWRMQLCRRACSYASAHGDCRLLHCDMVVYPKHTHVQLTPCRHMSTAAWRGTKLRLSRPNSCPSGPLARAVPLTVSLLRTEWRNVLCSMLINLLPNDSLAEDEVQTKVELFLQV